MDEIDELLTPRTLATDSARRDALRNETGRTIRRRRLRVYARRALAMAACYLAGIGTLWLIQRRDEPTPQAPAVAQRPTEAPEEKQPVDKFRNDRPDQIERWAAMASGDRRADLYRKAGDRFLERGNEGAALRCYRHSLQNARPESLAIRAEQDTWLLMSLKLARKKEESDVRN